MLFDLFGPKENKELLFKKIEYCIANGAKEYADKAFSGMNYKDIEDIGLLKLSLSEMTHFLKTHGRPQIESELKQIEESFIRK